MGTQELVSHPKATAEVEMGTKAVEVSVQLFSAPHPERKHLHIGRDQRLLEVLDEGAEKLKVELLPNPKDPLDRLRGVYEDRQVGEPLNLSLSLGEFLDGQQPTHHFAVELVLAIEINTRWRVAPESAMTPKAILALAGLPWEEYSLYYPPDSTVPLSPDNPVELHRGQRFEAQRDGKYGEGAGARCER